LLSLYLLVLLLLSALNANFLMTQYDRPIPRSHRRSLHLSSRRSRPTRYSQPLAYLSRLGDRIISKGIKTATGQLSPYLPFAGGMDLRRIWSEGWYDMGRKGVGNKGEEGE
jgi:hypothetical protein